MIIVENLTFILIRLQKWYVFSKCRVWIFRLIMLFVLVLPIFRYELIFIFSFLSDMKLDSDFFEFFIGELKILLFYLLYIIEWKLEINKQWLKFYKLMKLMEHKCNVILWSVCKIGNSKALKTNCKAIKIYFFDLSDLGKKLRVIVCVDV